MENQSEKETPKVENQDSTNDLLENDTILEAEQPVELSETEQLSAQIDELKDRYTRLMADFDNFRKQTMRQRADLIQTAGRDTMKTLLPVLDDFDRAAKNETLSEGMNLVFNKFQNALKSNGLREMDTPQGINFDADQHEAITEIPAFSEDLKGKIIDTVEKGYLLNDKIIRHAKVVLGK